MQRKLKNYLIHPRFQISLIGINIAITLLILGMTFWQLVNAENMLYIAGRNFGIPMDHEYFSILNSSFDRIENLLLLVGLISLLLSFFMTLLLSHKMAGPFYKIKSYFTALRDGAPLSDLYFRKGDYFDDVPPVINEVLKKTNLPRAEETKPTN